MTGPEWAGKGAQLLAAARAAADHCEAVSREYDTLPFEDRKGWFARRQAAIDAYQAAAGPLYAYFGSDQPSAEERAAWELLSPVRWRRPHGASRER